MDRAISADEASVILRGASDCEVRDVRVGHGSFVTMSFIDSKKLPAAEYFLWIYCSGWNLASRSSLLVASEDSQDRITQAISTLEGSRLESVALHYPSMSLVLSFSGGLTLSTATVYSRGYEHWMWRLPSDEWLVAGPGSAFYVDSQRADLPN